MDALLGELQPAGATIPFSPIADLPRVTVWEVPGSSHCKPPKAKPPAAGSFSGHPVNRLAAEAAAVADGRVVWDETTSVLSHGDRLKREIEKEQLALTAGMRAAVLPAGAALLELAAEEWLSQWIDNEGREAR